MDGLWRAEVTSVSGATCTIEIHRLTGTRTARYVPICLPLGGVDAGLGDTSAPAGDSTVALRPLEVGDQVLVGLLEGSWEHPIVLGRIAG